MEGGEEEGAPYPPLRLEGALVVRCLSEHELLSRWREWLLQHDPDVLACFEVRDNLGALAQRAAALALPPRHTLAGGPHSAAGAEEGVAGELQLSRLLPQYSPGLGTKSVVQYSPAWVKSQSRMASTSNQETFRALGLGGRLVFDILRQVLTHKSLATFTLADCVHTLLHQRLEVLAPEQLACLWRQMHRGQADGQATGSETGGNSALDGHTDLGAAPDIASSPQAAAARLARYCLRRTGAIRELMETLATIPEAFEMARVTGLSISEVCNKAQMSRTWSLLLRNARRHRYLVGGRQEVGQLVESPYLMHPIEAGTAGLYSAPVATLDFASLYPSLYRAHNLCYTTLVVREDIQQLGHDQVEVSPCGNAFVKASVRQGVCPIILAALMTARARTRAALKQLPPDAPAAAWAVLDCRQKALKVTANALYGFTGAQASPLQCVPLADSCLAYGAAACRAAIAEVPRLVAEGVGGPAGRDARVIYGQTDSLFLLYPHATPAQAVTLAKQAARLISQRCFQPPMALSFERVCCPFLLLHVNRYAGRAFEDEAQASGAQPSSLLVKGVRSMWRQSAPIVQQVLGGALRLILMDQDIPAATAFAQEQRVLLLLLLLPLLLLLLLLLPLLLLLQIQRLLSGQVQLWELVMTGGLWRITGSQVAQAALEASGAAPAGGGRGVREEVRGPHATLAVKLAQRDPGTTFLLGQRLPFILLAGERLQDDAAELPLLVAERGLVPDTKLYYTHKLKTPLSEIFDKVVSPAELQHLLAGPHTHVRVEQLAAEGGAAAAGAGGAAGAAIRGSLAPAGTKGLGTKAGAKQSGLTSFFKHTFKCLACKQPLTAPTAPPSPAPKPSRHHPTPPTPLPPPPSPGLCSSCCQQPGQWQAVEVGLVGEAQRAAQRLSAAVSHCTACHSGGLAGPLACSNAECEVLFERLDAARKVAGAEEARRRLRASCPPEGTACKPAAEPTKGKGKGKAAKAKPAPQPGRWLDRDCNAALNMQRIGESRWRPLELCYWKDQGALPAKGKEYPGLGYKRLRDKPPEAQEQQQQPAEAQ
ncbi:DNA polymerase family B-domain-containing protein [Haematococcus lacustris]